MAFYQGEVRRDRGSEGSLGWFRGGGGDAGGEWWFILVGSVCVCTRKPTRCGLWMAFLGHFLLICFPRVGVLGPGKGDCLFVCLFVCCFFFFFFFFLEGEIAEVGVFTSTCLVAFILFGGRVLFLFLCISCQHDGQEGLGEGGEVLDTHACVCA